MSHSFCSIITVTSGVFEGCRIIELRSHRASKDPSSVGAESESTISILVLLVALHSTFE